MSTAALPDVHPDLQIIDVVGRGGHSTVYRARQRSHDRVVAVKVLDSRLTDPVARRRFERERTTLGRVSDHPCVVSLLGSGFTTDGHPYLVLEYAPGGSLADHLAARRAHAPDGGRMSLDEVTALGICLAGALEQAHRSGVVHRDIKPGNVVRSPYGDWLLADFSVAAFADPDLATDAIHVSLAHCAPESFGRPAPAAPADVYSLASVLYTAATGREPFRVRDGETVTRTIARIVGTEPPPAHGVEPRLADLLRRAMAKDPAARPASMRAVAGELAAVRAATGLPPVAFRVGGDVTVTVDEVVGSCGAPHVESTVPAGERTPRRWLRRALASAAALVTVTGGAIVVTDAGTGADPADPGDAPAAATEAATAEIADDEVGRGDDGRRDGRSDDDDDGAGDRDEAGDGVADGDGAGDGDVSGRPDRRRPG